jgi:hypothetical protein
VSKVPWCDLGYAMVTVVLGSLFKCAWHGWVERLGRLMLMWTLAEGR